MSILDRLRRRDGHWRDEDLSAFVDGELRASQALALESHVAGCAVCAAKVAEFRDLKAMSASLPRARAPRAFTLTPAMAGERQAIEPQRRSSLAFVPAVALTVFIALVAVDLSSSGSGGGFSASENTTALSRQSDKDASAGASQPELAPSLSGSVESAPVAPPSTTTTDTTTGAADSAADQPPGFSEPSTSDGISAYTILEVFAALVFVVSLGMLIRQWLAQRKVGSQ